VGFFLDAPATIKEVVQELREIFNEDPVVNELVKFLENPSRQGIMRRKPFEGEEAF
jgi:UDP-N-acetylglucosamine acyltransferase